MRPRNGVCGGAKIFGSAYYSQRAVFASLWALFSFAIDNFIHRKQTIEHNTNQIKLNNN